MDASCKEVMHDIGAKIYGSCGQQRMHHLLDC